MRTRHTLALGVVLLAAAGCHLSFASTASEPGARSDAGSVPVGGDAAITPLPDAAASLSDAGVDAAAACRGLPPPTPRFVNLGNAPCDAATFATPQPIFGLRVTAQPAIEGVHLDFLTSQARDRDYRCRLEVAEVGTDLADGQPAGPELAIDTRVLEARDGDILVSDTAECDTGSDCSAPLVLWLGSLPLPAVGTRPGSPPGRWIRWSAGRRLCSTRPSRCTQGLSEVEVEVSFDRAPPTRLVLPPGESTVVPILADRDRLHLRVFDTPTDCGPTDGASDLLVTFAAWQSYSDPP